MTPTSDSAVTLLKALAKHSRWAFEELVIDQKMQEANRLCSGTTTGMYQYLLTVFGSKDELAGAVAAIAKQRRPYKSLVLANNGKQGR